MRSGASTGPGSVAIAQRASQPAVVRSAENVRCSPASICKNAVSEMILSAAPCPWSFSPASCFDP